MKLYNTLTRQVEEVKPLDGKEVRVYSCGPTVYDHVHIGNLVSFIYADTLRRALAGNGLKTKHVMNLTDVDDKTIRRSQEEYAEFQPEEALTKLTEKYIEIFYEDIQAIGNDVSPHAITFTKATDSTPEMQELINFLLDRNFAYVAADGIYFSLAEYVQSGKKYGQLSAVSASSTSESRIQNDEYDKESVHDFALWKRQKPGEPAWQYQAQGRDMTGRPGWHIECSAMSKAHLGQPFDIHTGGIDLIFPHHENEIAQSTAGKNDSLFAKLFFHNEHLLVDDQKMSKSLNNFYTLNDIKEKGFDHLAFRVLTLQSHYRNQVHFSWESLAAAQNRLQDLRAMAALRWQPRAVTHDNVTFALEDVPTELAAILADDLKTPQALAFLSDISTQLLTVHIEQDEVDHFETMLKGIDDLLGLNLLAVSDITNDQKALIAQRDQARAEQDWSKSDRLRDELAAQGVGLQDHPHGTIWFPLS